MQLLIIFETVEGQTGRIVRAVADQARQLGHDVTLHDLSDKSAALPIDSADRIILAAPVHERRHPPNFEAMLSARGKEIAARPGLLLSVSLKAAFPEGREEAQDYLTEMKMRTGFKPAQEALVAGAVRMNSYDYFQSQIVRHVALAGHDVELQDGVKEFTDWDALRETVSGFLDA